MPNVVSKYSSVNINGGAISGAGDRMRNPIMSSSRDDKPRLTQKTTKVSHKPSIFHGRQSGRDQSNSDPDVSEPQISTINTVMCSKRNKPAGRQRIDPLYVNTLVAA